MLGSGLSETIDDGEPLARFITSSSHFNAIGVKPAAFLPRRDETSVFRQQAGPELAILANRHLAQAKNIFGAAMIAASAVRAAALDVMASEPPPKHANIIGWPSLQNDPELRKAHLLEIAAVIARHAEFIRI